MKPKFPEAYRLLLRRYNELKAAGKHGLTREEMDEMQTVAAELERYELADRQQTTIAALVDDYVDVTLAGDMSGVEL